MIQDYNIKGSDLQLVELKVKPQQSILSQTGSMIYMDKNMEMKATLGAGKAKNIGAKLLNAGKLALSGEGAFLTKITNTGDEMGIVAFSGDCLGKIIPVNLDEIGGVFICQKETFLCADENVSISVQLQKKLSSGFWGGEGFILQKIKGKGMLFAHAGGMIVEKELKAGEVLKIDTGNLVGMTPEVDFSIETVKGIKTALFAGEGLFLSVLKGPGKVWIQSMPFTTIASKVAQYTANIDSK